MPSHDFTNIGDVLDFDILRGTITAIDSATDTCTVSVSGASREALLFYHCEPDSTLRDNGAIEGAAAGFAVDDEVIVMVRKDREVVKVIAHIDGARHCSEYAIFLISGSGEKSVAVIWSIKSNELVMGPIDITNPQYTDWIASHNNMGDDLFSGFLWDITSPYKINPELIDPEPTATDFTLYHDYEDVLGVHEKFPESVYASILQEDSPITYAGLRTQQVYHADVVRQILYYYVEEDYSRTWTWFTYPDKPPGEPYIGLLPGQWGSGGRERRTGTITRDFTFYGPLGVIGSFGETEDLYWDEIYGGDYQEYDLDRYLIPGWHATIDPLYSEVEQYAKGKEWYGSSISGKFTAASFALCTMIQYTPCAYTKDLVAPGEGNYTYSWTFGSRSYLIQAQAAVIPEGGDWQSSGNNTTLAGLISSGVEMFYSINSFPAKELQSVWINVNIMK